VIIHNISYLKISSLYYITRELDIKSQLGFSMNKNDILQNEIDDLKAKITKLANIVTDTNSRLVFYMNKNENLKKEIEDLKVKNTKITEAFWKSAAEVTRAASENLALELEKSRAMRRYTSEFGPEFEPEFSDIFKTDYADTHSLEDCYHNPGGATVYTKANAMNRMVFNPLLGIYEPGDEK
jgi:chromosome segregation ATPase